MEFVKNLILGGLCEIVALFIFAACHRFERYSIVELGYRSVDRKYKVDDRKLKWFDRIFFWNLCKNRKLRTRAVWVYFAMNLFLCVGMLISVPVYLYLAFETETRMMFLYWGAYTMAVLYLWAIPHFVLDLVFLPSVRKRYKIKKKPTSGRR